MGGIDMRWRLIARALSVRNRRVFVVFAALMTGAAIVTALAAIYFDIEIKLSRELRTFGANFYLGPAHERNLPEAAFDRILEEAPTGLIAAGSPYLYGRARSELEIVPLVGVRFESIRPLVPYWQIEGQWIGVGFDDRNAMIGRTLAKRLNVKPGDTLSLVKDGARKSLRIKAVVDAGDTSDSLLFVNLAAAQNWLGETGVMSHALFSVSNTRGEAEAFAEHMRVVHPDWTIRPIRKISANEGQIFGKIKGLMGLVSIIVLLLSTLCVNTSLTALVGERRREFALQKALGAANRTIMLQIMTETLVIAAAATLVGCLLGFILAQGLAQAVFASTIALRAPVIPIVIVLSLGVALAAAAVPVRRIVQIHPATVLKGE